MGSSQDSSLKSKLLDATSGGLEILRSLYPSAISQWEQRPKKPFSIRQNDKTPSASLIWSDSQQAYLITDFGDDGKGRNAIDQWMKERRVVDFSEAIKALCAQFGVSSNGKGLSGASFKKEAAKKEDRPGWEEDKTSLTEAELKIFGRYATLEAIKYCRVVKLKRYWLIKNGEKMVFESNEHYPIFAIKGEKFIKVYQPLAADKKHRFMYLGEKVDKNYIFGLEALEKYADRAKDQITDPEDNAKKLPILIICAGDRDAVNVRSLGYPVVWSNSETQVFTHEQMGHLREMAKEIYYCGDIDHTGRVQSHEWCLKHLGVRKIVLPESLRLYRDGRKNPRKDVTDYLQIYAPFQFERLLVTAYPYRFWDRKWKIERDENKEKIFVPDGYKFNQAYCLRFLEGCGFGRLADPAFAGGYQFVKLEGNIVHETDAYSIKNYIKDFLFSRGLDVEIVNLILGSPKLNEASLHNLSVLDIQFQRADDGRQYWFFESDIWEITADGIHTHKPGSIDRYIWCTDIINPKVEKSNLPFRPQLPKEGEKPPFEIAFDEEGNASFPHIEYENTWMQFLVNTAKIHWKAEFDRAKTDRYVPFDEIRKNGLHTIAGKHLEEDERKTQNLTLANRLHTLGYLAYRHKSGARPWALWLMDNADVSATESHGGSGKSIVIDSLKHLCRVANIPGRTKNLTEDRHALEEVSKFTDILFIDDCANNLDFGFFFPMITGPMTINAKHTKRISIQFSESPKLAFTTNFALKNIDSSTERRLYYSVNSDWYHQKSEHNARTRTPMDDFGIQLFDNFSHEQWNGFFLTMAHCLQFFLSRPAKIEPPMDNVEKRNLRAIMGDSFLAFGNEYFPDFILERMTDEAKPILRTEMKAALHDFDKNMDKLSTQALTKKIQAWAKYHDCVFDPPHSVCPQMPEGRFVRNDVNGKSSGAHLIVRKSAIDIALPDAIAEASRKFEQFAKRVNAEQTPGKENELPY